MSRFNEFRERILAAVDVAQGDGGERYAQGFKDAATLFLEMLDIVLADYPHSSGEVEAPSPFMKYGRDRATKEGRDRGRPRTELETLLDTLEELQSALHQQGHT